MSEIIFKFDTTGDDGIEEERAATRCFKSLDMTIALYKIWDHLRLECERMEHPDSRAEYLQAERSFKKFNAILAEYTIDLDDLII